MLCCHCVCCVLAMWLLFIQCWGCPTFFYLLSDVFVTVLSHKEDKEYPSWRYHILSCYLPLITDIHIALLRQLKKMVEPFSHPVVRWSHCCLTPGVLCLGSLSQNES